MKRYLILAPFILLLLVAPVHSKSVLVIYEVDDFGFAQLPAAGWEADVDVRAFDQSIAWRNRRCPTDKDFEDIDGVVYIMNYDAVVPEPLGMALQTLHQVREFVSEGGRAVVLLQSPVRAADESFAGYLRKHFDIIHVAKKCHGDDPQTIVRFPLDGGVLMPELAGTTIGGSELRGLCGWFTVKPGSWLGQSVGSYAPPRYLGARRSLGAGEVHFAIDAHYGSVFSDKNIESFDNFAAFREVLMWAAGRQGGHQRPPN